MALKLPTRSAPRVAPERLANAIGAQDRPALLDLLPRGIAHEGVVLDQHIREGRFQRSLAVITALASILGGLEVTYEHYQGSYGQRIMYSPVLLSPIHVVVSIWSIFSRRVARVVLPIVSIVLILDGVIGFIFHVRGVARKPGGWRIPIVNVIMGPPIFAPLLFTISGYLGLITALLRREDAPQAPDVTQLLPGSSRTRSRWLDILPRGISREGITLEQHVREGRFQRQLAAAAAISALFSGVEALYSHYKNNFTYWSQWTPIILTPVLFAGGIGTIWSRRIARTLLPAASILAILDGALGAFYHGRGILRRPGGLKTPFYNVIYGPPIFAPLLFAASGFMGLLASLLRRGD